MQVSCANRNTFWVPFTDWGDCMTGITNWFNCNGNKLWLIWGEFKIFHCLCVTQKWRKQKLHHKSHSYGALNHKTSRAFWWSRSYRGGVHDGKLMTLHHLFIKKGLLNGNALLMSILPPWGLRSVAAIFSRVKSVCSPPVCLCWVICLVLLIRNASNSSDPLTFFSFCQYLFPS